MLWFFLLNWNIMEYYLFNFCFPYLWRSAITTLESGWTIGFLLYVLWFSVERWTHSISIQMNYFIGLSYDYRSILVNRGGATYTASPAMAGPLFKVVRPDIHLAGPLFSRVNWQIQELVHKYKFTNTEKGKIYITDGFGFRSLRS